MKYKFVMKHDYHEIVFIFKDYEEGCTFMSQAIANADTSISFVISKYEEGDEDEVI